MKSVKITNKRVVNPNSFFKITELKVDQIRDDGRIMHLTREVASREGRGEAVHVLIHDPDLDLVCLVSQFRASCLESNQSLLSGLDSSDNHPYSIEVVAGMIDGDETPAQAAIRESKEETGIDIRNVKTLNKKPLFMCAGMTNEKTNIVVAQADLGHVQAFAGEESEGEETEILTVSTAQLQEMIKSGDICDAPSLLAISLSGVLNSQDNRISTNQTLS